MKIESSGIVTTTGLASLRRLGTWDEVCASVILEGIMVLENRNCELTRQADSNKMAIMFLSS